MMKSGNSMNYHGFKICHESGFEPKTSIYFDQLMTSYNMAASGLGVCFVTDTEHCMQGGDSSYYNANKTLLQGQETWFNNHSGSCSFGDSSSYCSGGGFRRVTANSRGYVYAGVSGSDGCEVFSDGRSHCYVS